MFGSDILEVAIAMAFLYLFMSTIASALREAFEAYLQHRAVFLQRGLVEMLRTGKDKQFVEKFYNHPLISSLYMGDYTEKGGKTKAKQVGPPPPAQVGPPPPAQVGPPPPAQVGPPAPVQVVPPAPVQVVPPAPVQVVPPAPVQVVPPAPVQVGPPAPVQGKKPKLPAYIPKESFSLAVLDIVAEASQAGQILSLPDLETKLKALNPPNAVQRVVLTAFAAAGRDLGGIREYLENWYDSAMERVTGWYTRRTAVFLFVFGLGAAVALNVDSIAIARRLLVDRPLRQAIVAQAEKYRDEQAAGQATPPAPAPGKPSQDDGSSGKIGTETKGFPELRSEFEEIGFPIGWTYVEGSLWPYPAPQACLSKPSPHGGTTFDCSKSAGSVYWWTMLLALMGWLVTAIAIMLGAPFWFDLLNKLVSLRSSPKPADAKPTPKKAKPARAGSSGPTQQGATGATG